MDTIGPFHMTFLNKYHYIAVLAVDNLTEQEAVAIAIRNQQTL